jgi:hypothetical protein
MLAARSDPSQVDRNLIEHFNACGYCANQLEQADQQALRDLMSSSVIGPDESIPRRSQHRPRELDSGFWKLFGATTILHSILNPLISFVSASGSKVSGLDFWRLFQSSLVRTGVILAVLFLIATAGIAWYFRLRKPSLLAAFSVLSFLAVTSGVYGWAEIERAAVRKKLEAMFMEHRFAAFDSPSFDPDTNPNPTPEELRQELAALHEFGGFDGLITFGPYGWEESGSRKELPRLAKEAGFRAMIAGIYVGPDGTKPSLQMQRAVEFERETLTEENIIVGYCVGHNVPPSVRLDDLAEWMDELRKATGKPVSSTFPVVAYLGERGLQVREIGDFCMPDVHSAWHLGTSPQKALEETSQALERLTVLPADRPTLLKMIMFPSAGAPGLSEESQKQFFDGVARDLYLPRGVYVSVFGFDSPFKGKRKAEFAPSEEFAGLLTADRRAKPALKTIRQKWPVQNRP